MAIFECDPTGPEGAGRTGRDIPDAIRQEEARERRAMRDLAIQIALGLVLAWSISQ